MGQGFAFAWSENWSEKMLISISRSGPQPPPKKSEELFEPKWRSKHVLSVTQINLKQEQKFWSLPINWYVNLF